MEDFFCLREVFQKGNLMCKLDMRDAHFSVPNHQSSRKYLCFLWAGNLYEFLCLCFGLSAVPRIFTKLLEVRVSVLRRINISNNNFPRWYFFDRTNYRGRFNVQVQCKLSFSISGVHSKLEKHHLSSVQEIEFLGLKVSSLDMTFSQTQGKMLKVQTQCRDLLKQCLCLARTWCIPFIHSSL